MSTSRLGILISGRGSNLQAIAIAIESGLLRDVEIGVVVSNRAEAPGMDTARQRGIPALVVSANGRSREEQDAEMVSLLRDYSVDLVCLAGYMRLLSPRFVCAFPNRILNIHPSLLPAFPGLDAQRQAWEYGVAVSGCTVHFVDEQLDHGAIVLQRSVPVEDADTPESLAARILKEEHVAYSEAIARVVSGEWQIEGRRYVRRQPLAGPL